jgi:hypothetical protein
MIRQAGYTMTCDTCGAAQSGPDCWPLLRECAAAGWDRFAEKDICPRCKERTTMAELATFEDLRKSDEDFYSLLRTVADTFVRKNHDYTSNGLFGPGSNLLRCEEFDVPAWKGVLIRLGDKWSRLTTFAKKGLLAVKDESVEDTFLDMAIYSLLGVLAYRRAREADRKPWPAGTAFEPMKPEATGTATWPLKEVPSALATRQRERGPVPGSTPEGVANYLNECGPPAGENPYPCPTGVVPRVQPPVPTPTERR